MNCAAAENQRCFLCLARAMGFDYWKVFWQLKDNNLNLFKEMFIETHRHVLCVSFAEVIKLSYYQIEFVIIIVIFMFLLWEWTLLAHYVYYSVIIRTSLGYRYYYYKHYNTTNEASEAYREKQCKNHKHKTQKKSKCNWINVECRR